MKWIVWGVLAAAFVVASLWWMQIGPFAPAPPATAKSVAVVPVRPATGDSAAKPAAAAQPPRALDVRDAGTVPGQIRRMQMIAALPDKADVPAAEKVELLAAELAHEIEHPTSVGTSRGSFMAPTSVAKSAITNALAKVGKGDRAALAQAAEGKQGEAREWLLCARGLAGDASAAPALRAVLDSDGPDRRIAAAHALAELGDREAIPKLTALLEDPYVATYELWGEDRELKPVREAAVSALKRLGVKVESPEPGEFRVGGEP